VGILANLGLVIRVSSRNAVSRERISKLATGRVLPTEQPHSVLAHNHESRGRACAPSPGVLNAHACALGWERGAPFGGHPPGHQF
jgi:hypothetical protein